MGGIGLDLGHVSLCGFHLRANLTEHVYENYIYMTLKEREKDPWHSSYWYGEADRYLRYKTWDKMILL